MSNTEVKKSDVWKAEGWRSWEGRLVDGKFTLRRLLGGSDHSAVFLTERQSAQKAAIKLISVDPRDADALLSNWRRTAQLSHPHLLPVFESGRCTMDGTLYLYLLMECADEDLSQILPHRALTPAEATELLPPLLDALSYLHSKKLVHGRLKPSNVLAVADKLKLSTDYVAQMTEMNPDATRRDVYDPPEAAAGILSPAGDMWSMGVTLVAALTQHVPLGELSVRDPVAPDRMPEPFRGIVRECLHLDPRRRCTVADVQARLRPAARVVPATPEPVTAPEQPMKRGKLIAAVLSIAVVLGIVALYLRSKNSPAPMSPTDQFTQSAAPPASSQTAEPATQQNTTSQAPAAAPATSQPVTPQTSASPPSRQKSRPSNAGNGVVKQVIPDVPRSARNTISGRIRVIVRVEVDSSGNVTNATLASPGPSRYFAGLALKAAQGWEFAPQASPDFWSLVFHFGRKQTQVTPERLKTKD